MLESVNKAFSRQSEIFDQYEKNNEILNWMRTVTHRHLLLYLNKNDHILELNAGTGLDAVFLSSMGFRIHCVDISEGMINKLRQKILYLNLNKFITYQLLSFTELNKLNEKPFDYIISNFGGLNCSPDISSVFLQFSKILKPGGKVSLVIIPPVCLWEVALIFKGKFKTAFRRLKKR